MVADQVYWNAFAQPLGARAVRCRGHRRRECGRQQLPRGWSGRISENVGTVSSSGSATGSLIGSGSFAGNVGVNSVPLDCPSTSSAINGRLVLAAATGGTLREKLSGTACQSVLAPPTIASDQTFVIEGGTGPFQYATGHGSMTSTSVFSTGNYPVTSSGSTTFTERGRIDLNLSARLSATPAKCVQAALPARVTGKGIASVEWSLNGTPVKGHTVRRKTRYAALVKLSPGRHRLTARVTFIAPGLAPAQTFHRVVLGCSPSPPVFTG